MEAFVSASDMDLSLIPLIVKVGKEIGVVSDYEKNLALVNAICAEINNYGEKQINRDRQWCNIKDFFGWKYNCL